MSRVEGIGRSDIELSIVIPLYNEERFLRRALGALLEELDQKLQASAEVLLVENGSRDGTPMVARALAEERAGRIRLLSLPEPDYGRALREGFRQARGKYIANFDLDYMDVDFVRDGLGRMEHFDVIIAAKNLPGSEDRRPWNRRLITWGFQRVLHLLFDFPFQDTHGIKLWRTRAIQPLLERVRFDRDLFDTELILRGIRDGWRVAEVPVVVHEMRPARLSILPRILRTLRDLIRLRITLWREP